MKRIFVLFFSLIISQCFAQKKELYHLWPGQVPGETGLKKEPFVDTTRKDGVLRYAEITNPAIEVWIAPTGKERNPAIVVCPGGAYSYLAYSKEGTEIAEWLNKCGFNAFILQYRVPQKQNGALQDAQRALRVIRSKASEWKTDPGKVGIMGFSAGGSLSARTSILHYKKTYYPVDSKDSLSCRPDCTMLIYPAYLDQGENRTLTPELKIAGNVPPVFIFQTSDDTYGNSALVMAGALRDAGFHSELHYLPQGGHGYGIRAGNVAAKTCPLLAEKWLNKTITALTKK